MFYRIVRPHKSKIHEVIKLCIAHAEFEKSSYSAHGKDIQLKEDLWGKAPKLSCLVAESEDKYIGYITWMKQYSTWDAGEYLYMDCLYIMEDYRGYGIGEELVNLMMEYGKAHNINMVQWQTPTFNKRAMKFYERIGATSKSKERYFLKI